MLRHKLSIFMAAALLFGLMSGCASMRPASQGPAAAQPVPSQPETPVISEFVLGVGDSFDVAIYRSADLSSSSKINPSGVVMLPLIGDVKAAGKSVFAFRDELRERYSKYLVDPQVSINITAVQSRKILVLGEVKTPGAYPLDTDMTLLEAVGKAGGWNQEAKRGHVVLVRYVSGKPEARAYDINKVLSGDVPNNVHLQSNDIVYVQTKAITNIARFMTDVNSILSPLVTIESGIAIWPQVINAVTGKTSTSTIAIPTR